MPLKENPSEHFHKYNIEMTFTLTRHWRASAPRIDHSETYVRFVNRPHFYEITCKMSIYRIPYVLQQFIKVHGWPFLFRFFVSSLSWLPQTNFYGILFLINLQIVLDCCITSTAFMTVYVCKWL